MYAKGKNSQCIGLKGPGRNEEGTTRINRHYYELCVLQQLERALKGYVRDTCKNRYYRT
jgi:hypothetical protein